ncbi:MAG: glycosyl transferase [Alphaproteobacteria bacterium]|nr:glycosyl transferase [Alphaproteobacteria bacterium]
MSAIKEQLKGVSWIADVYDNLKKKYYQCLTIISPRLNTKARFRQKGRPLDLHDPKTLDEKIQCLKLTRYGKDPLVKQCADKYAVRKYIEDKGCSDLLVPLIAVYDKVRDIQWDKLPDAFAMKWNFGCGFNIICADKTTLDIEDAKKKMKKWGKDRGCYLDYAEMQYKGVRRKIIVEEYLKPETGLVPADYKVYCFNGQPKFILVCVGRENDKRPKFYFFDENWELARINPDSKKAPEGFSYPKPSCFDKLMQSAKTLSAPFEFVRADFYVVNNKVYFGELTFTPAGGTDPNRLRETDLMFGKMLKI